MRMKSTSLVCAVLLILLLAGCAQNTPLAPLAVNGVLDLTSWNFKQDGSLNLNGAWVFYWQELLGPEDFASVRQPSPTGFFSIPGIWNKHRVDGTPLGGDGFATFRLKVHLAPDATPKAVHILNQSSAYTLWINGKEVARNGVVGKSEENVTPQYLLQEVVFFEESPVLDIIVQLANFHHRKGGVWNPIRLGLASQIKSRHNQQWIFDLFLFGSLLIMGLYHFSLYLLHKEDPSALFFAVFTLVMAVRVLVSGNFYLTLLFPDMPWELIYKVELLSVFIPPPALLLFITSIFNRQRSIGAVSMFVGLGGVFSLIILLTPARISGHLVLPNQVVLLLNIGYMLNVLFRALRQGEKGAGIILAGIAIVGCTAVLDILNANRILYTIQLVPFGVLCLIFSQSFVLSFRFADAFKGVIRLSRELEQKNIALERMDQIKDEFLANTSHELRTPLNGIIGLAESIKDGSLGRLPDIIRENLGLIAASGRRLSGLINDILDYSRLRNRDLHLNKEAVDIGALTDTILALSKPLTQGKDLVLKNQVPDNLPCVHGDELRLQQILYNLVGNAIKYTESGAVRVTAAQKDSMVEVRVTDTGIGIAQEHFETIFKSFEQVRGTNSRPFGGVGLGLAITRHLVELHQGAIGVSSLPNQGTTFYFTIPVSHENLAADRGFSVAEPLLLNTGQAAPRSLAMDRVPQENIANAQKILVVDDDRINLQVVKNQLSFLDGVVVHTRMNGPEALDWIEKKGCPDLVLLDIMMPQMTGYEVCRILRQKYTAHELPVIILTAKNRVTDLAQGFACGASDYLTKPFAREELLARVQTQLDLKQSYETLRENLRLKKEIEQRKLTELDLWMMQRQLSRILDTLDDAVIAVNESLEIAFCNYPCEKMLGYDVEKLLGQPVKNLFPPDTPKETEKTLDRMILNDCPQGIADPIDNITILHADASRVPCRILCTPLDMDSERLLVMILQKAEKKSGKQNSRFGRVYALQFIEELNQNRQRIQILEESLHKSAIAVQKSEMRQGLKKIDAMLARMGNTLTGNAIDLDKQKLGIRVMNLALQYWENSTGSTKVELAKSSNIWKVYMNQNGFERTQTLDKYLDIKQFPKIPRWNRVFQTADFILLSCRTPSNLRDELETELSKLRMLK